MAVSIGADRITPSTPGGGDPTGAPRHFQRFPIRFFDRNLTQLLPADREPEQWIAAGHSTVARRTGRC